MNRFCDLVRKKVPGILLGTFCFLAIAFSFQIQFSEKEDVRFLLPPPHLEHMTFGNSEVLADLFWIRTIQDLDHCEQSVAENVCKNNSWLYYMLETITNLAPSFRAPYAVGSLALTIIITDIEGATKIFDKGLKHFPNDGPMLFRAAYHYLYELNDKKTAAELLVRAGHNGAPQYAFALAGRLYSDSGYVELAESLLAQMKAEQKDPVIVQRLEDKIRSIKNVRTSK